MKTDLIPMVTVMKLLSLLPPFFKIVLQLKKHREVKQLSQGRVWIVIQRLCFQSMFAFTIYDETSCCSEGQIKVANKCNTPNTV